MAQRFQFGDFRFAPAIPLLTRHGRRLDLSPKALAVLAELIRNAGQVVSKDALLDSVWPDSVVEEANLAVHISALRKALGPGRIETIPRLGYRFAVDLSPDPCAIAECYLQQQTADGCRRAAAEYRKVLDADPYSVGAQTGLANTLLLRLVIGDLAAASVVPRARALLDQAIRIDPADPVAHLSRSRLLSLAEWRWKEAEDELDHAAELAADSQTRATVQAWQGLHQLEHGNQSRGLDLLRRAHTAAPLSPFVARFHADGHFLARDYAASAGAARESLALHPHCWSLNRTLGRALTMLGDFDQARRSYRRASMLYGGRPAVLRADIAYLNASTGVAPKQPLPLVPLAQTHTALGNHDRALDCLERAAAHCDWALSSLKQDPRFDPLRASPRFRSILRLL